MKKLKIIAGTVEELQEKIERHYKDGCKFSIEAMTAIIDHGKILVVMAIKCFSPPRALV